MQHWKIVTQKAATVSSTVCRKLGCVIYSDVLNVFFLSIFKRLYFIIRVLKRFLTFFPATIFLHLADSFEKICPIA